LVSFIVDSDTFLYPLDQQNKTDREPKAFFIACSDMSDSTDRDLLLLTTRLYLLILSLIMELWLFCTACFISPIPSRYWQARIVH